MKKNELQTKDHFPKRPFQSSSDADGFDLNMNEVESRNMPSIATSGWEITSILVILIVLLGVLYKHNF